MSNIAISELNTTAETINDNDLMLVSSYDNGAYTSSKISGAKLKQVFGNGGASCGLSSEIITQLLNRKICKIKCKYPGGGYVYPLYIKISGVQVPIGYDFENNYILFEFPYQLGALNIDSDLKGLIGTYTYSELNDHIINIEPPALNIQLTHNTINNNVIDLYVIVYDSSNNIVSRIGDFNYNNRTYQTTLYIDEGIDIQWLQSSTSNQAINIAVNKFNRNDLYYSVYAHIYSDSRDRNSANFTTFGVVSNIVYNDQQQTITPTTTETSSSDGKGLWKIFTFDITNGITVNNEYMTDSIL